jgi:pyruvate/2-oxoacid:ferredoxin oxidoreductase alpha subunit
MGSDCLFPILACSSESLDLLRASRIDRGDFYRISDQEDYQRQSIVTQEVKEGRRMHLPVIFAQDGYVTTANAMPVLMPDQEAVDRFLPPYKHEFVNLDHTFWVLLQTPMVFRLVSRM